jgi:hypothetical protein
MSRSSLTSSQGRPRGRRGATMPVEVRIIIVPDFLRVDAGGTLDLDQSRSLLQKIAGECKKCGTDRVLADLREVSRGPNIVDLYWLVDSFSDIGFGPEVRLAILYINQGLGQAQFFTDTAQNRGFQVELFEGFELAFEWLTASTAAGR